MFNKYIIPDLFLANFLCINYFMLLETIISPYLTNSDWQVLRFSNIVLLIPIG